MTDPGDSQAIQVHYDFKEYLKQCDLRIPPIGIETLQLNLTYMCNQACRHCHVKASPERTETMAPKVIDRCLDILATHTEIAVLDLTGGAPELNPHFRDLVIRARGLKKRVMVRHNLTVTSDGHPLTGAPLTDLPDFFAHQGVELVCSLPYYQPFFTDRQRGTGVFDKSIAALRHLNAMGYGNPGSDLVLNLVYNPAGAFLPADQAALENDFRRELDRRYGIRFTNLFTITNMPIFRFREQLLRIGVLEEYWKTLVAAFNPCAAQSVMCRNMVSVGWDGKLYDCDFNQMLGLQIVVGGRAMDVFNFNWEALLTREILVAPHCFGCTAGAGSSCGGSTA